MLYKFYMLCDFSVFNPEIKKCGIINVTINLEKKYFRVKRTVLGFQNSNPNFKKTLTHLVR